MVNITINISSGESKESATVVETKSVSGSGPGVHPLEVRVSDVETKHQTLVDQMGDGIQAFQSAKMGGYMSHFLITMEFLIGSAKGKVVSIVSPLAAQTVSWSDPFVYQGPEASHIATIPLPKSSSLSNIIRETDFFDKPEEYFQVGRESVWLQILNLDARMEHPDVGPIRIILGETLKREYPDLFLPSLGAAQSLGPSGFPARLFFNPCAIIETPFGSMRAVHGILSYGRVTGFPPVGTPVSISKMIPVEDVAALRQRVAMKTYSHEASFDNVVARIVALSHPIDMEIHLPGEETFEFVERLIDQNRPKI